MEMGEALYCPDTNNLCARVAIAGFIRGWAILSHGCQVELALEHLRRDQIRQEPKTFPAHIPVHSAEVLKPRDWALTETTFGRNLSSPGGIWSRVINFERYQGLLDPMFFTPLQKAIHQISPFLFRLNSVQPSPHFLLTLTLNPFPNLS